MRHLIIIIYLLLPFKSYADLAQAEAAIQETETEMAQERFLSFWQAFKEAVLKSDIDKLTNLTYFPFEVKQTVGEWGLDTLAAQEFKALMPTLLKQDSGDSIETETMVDYFARVKHVDKGSIDPEGIFAGSYIFKFIDKKWYFVRAHINTGSSN